jgi:hypothetical protein
VKDKHTGRVEEMNEGFYSQDREALSQCRVDIVTIDHLQDMHKRFPHVLSPAFAIQSAMMNTVFGPQWWAQNRIKLVKLRNAELERNNKACEEQMKRRRKWIRNTTIEEHLPKCLCCYCSCPCTCYLWECWNVFEEPMEMELRLLPPQKAMIIKLDKIGRALLMSKLMRSEEREMRQQAAKIAVVTEKRATGKDFEATPGGTIVALKGTVTNQPTMQQTTDLRRERSRKRLESREKKQMAKTGGAKEGAGDDADPEVDKGEGGATETQKHRRHHKVVPGEDQVEAIQSKSKSKQTEPLMVVTDM